MSAFEKFVHILTQELEGRVRVARDNRRFVESDTLAAVLGAVKGAAFETVKYQQELQAADEAAIAYAEEAIHDVWGSS